MTPSKARAKPEQSHPQDADDEGVLELERTLRNLALRLEQDQETLSAELSAVQELCAEVADRVGQLESTVADPEREQSEVEGDQLETAEERELKALRRQIAALHETVREVRRLKRGGRAPQSAPAKPKADARTKDEAKQGAA